MDLDKIQALIKFVAKSGVTEMKLETKEFKINIKTPSKGRSAVVMDAESKFIHTVPVVQPVVQTVVPAAAVQAPAQQVSGGEEPAGVMTDDLKYITIRSPMIGTFYRSSTPDKPAFVSIGDEISNGKVICIIEAMKLFNEIEAEESGKIIKVLVDDATPVEYDQPLFLVDPS